MYHADVIPNFGHSLKIFSKNDLSEQTSDSLYITSKKDSFVLKILFWIPKK